MKSSYKIAYIDFGKKFKQDGHSGIERKKRAQVSELGKIGNVKRLTYSPIGQNNLAKKIFRRLPFSPSMFAYYYSSNELDNADVIYYRRAIIDRYTIKLLKEIKVRNPKCLVILEIPTYPYDKELKDLSQLPLLYKERWNRKKLYQYVDRIATLTDDSMIFGIPIIKIQNGIDFSITSQRIISNEEDGIVHGVMVGNFQFWHGLDRLIEGMKNYYAGDQQRRKFILHVVGPTENVIIMDTETEELVVKGYIHFYGRVSFNETEKVYDNVSLAFEAFGVHRRSPGQISSSIKSREYGAKGLPIISGSKIDYIPEDYPYFYKVDEDDSPIDIESVVKFHDRVFADGYIQVADEIRAFAQERCSSEAMMKPVLEYCLEYFAKR